jgi:hypothetical protein
VLPFFSLLLIYTVFNAAEMTRPWKHFLFAGFILGIAMQLHYLSIFLAIIVLVYTFIAESRLNRKIVLIPILKDYFHFLIGFIVGFSPFLAFEARHGFPNTKEIFGFISTDTLHKTYEANASFFSTIADVFFRIFARLLFNFPTPDRFNQFSLISLQLWGLLIVIVAIIAIVHVILQKNTLVTIIVLLWLFLSIFLFGFYKKAIYDYLFTFLFPLPFLLIGNLFSRIYEINEKKKYHFIGIFLSLFLFFGLVFFNLKGIPFWNTPNRQKDQTKQIAEFVISQTDNKPFNFALISKGNSDYAYRYYLEILNHNPIQIDNAVNDPQRKTVTDQLLIVCEDIGCKPLGHPLFDVAAFGRAASVKDWDVSVVKVFKLVHYTEHSTR